MTPAAAIAMLDRQLAVHGRTITLRRGTVAAPIAMLTGVRAFVRGYKPEELSAGIAQSDSSVVLSPTDLSGWPGVLQRGDWAIIDGRTRSIEAAENVEIDDVLVRVNLQVKG